MGTHESFKEKLNKEHNWPDKYLFKFIVPKSKEGEVRRLFLNETLHEKNSKAGNYVSFTMEKMMQSADEVVQVYTEAKKIEGLIVL
jgi:uncharacterized protein